MRNRAIAAVVLVALIVGAVFIVKGCKKDETLPGDDQQEQQTDTPEENTQEPPVNVDDELLTVEEFIDLTKGSYGGDIIRRLREAYNKKEGEAT